MLEGFQGSFGCIRFGSVILTVGYLHLIYFHVILKYIIVQPIKAKKVRKIQKLIEMGHLMKFSLDLSKNNQTCKLLFQYLLSQTLFYIQRYKKYEVKHRGKNVEKIYCPLTPTNCLYYGMIK